MDDALTGLENEWSMRNHIVVSESGNAMFYAMVDINGLKSINEKYGENIGDSVVVHVADIARRSFPKPKATCIARGQNGCISVLFHTNHIEDAEKQMDWFRQLVETLPLDVDEGSIEATVSIGLTQLGDSVDATLSRGIKSLQQAKLKGRNQVYSCKIA
ncbi:GGDEF domain [Vibrio variabilis]|uniref:GGDEF domain n=1 Tax=Vibrio variabilis TaxID=990271 RepID=A0ABQ0JD56_9VIBR|nr:GGDEF domain [Vibrio variabilis]